MGSCYAIVRGTRCRCCGLGLKLVERIKEALKRSRRERDQQSDDGARARETRIARLDRSKIEYCQTKVVEASHGSLNQKRVVAGSEEHSAAAAYKVLRTQVLRRMQSQGWKTLAITSPGPGEGKSLTAVNLAISMSQQFGITVLLVDLDLRRSAISAYFDYEPAEGLTDHLLNGVPLDEILFNPGIERLTVLPAGRSLNEASEILRSSAMRDFTKELKNRYPERYVLFDLPPLLVGDDAMSFLPCADCALLVIEDGKSHPDEVTRAVELLQETRLIGSVLNKCKATTNHRYYQYY